MSQRQRFGEIVRAPRVPLGEGCLVIAEHLGHHASVNEGIGRLDTLADATAMALAGPADLDGIAHHLFATLGFTGDRSNYYEPRNSLLPEVLRRRIGIPITLAIVVLEVAERLGVAASGVGMPGHFLVGDGPRPTRWLDGFDGGIWLDQAGARARFHGIHGRAATFDPAFLEPTPGAHVLGRVLANLAGIYRGTGDPTALLRVLELRADIPLVGALPRAQVELAEAQAGVGRITEAIEVLEALRARVDPRQHSALDDRLAVLRAGLN